MDIIKTPLYVITNWKEFLNRTKNLYETDARYTQIKEIFLDQEYFWLIENAKANTTVLDIGANIGDTPIYFAQFEIIKKVVGYEPIRGTFEEAQQLVRDSPFAEKIRLVNCGITGSKQRIVIPPSFKGNSGTKFGDKIRSKTGSGDAVKGILLSEALSKLNNVVIKIDCEGEEHNLFNNLKPSDLSNVYKMQIEVHEGMNGLDRKIARLGFKVKISQKERNLFLYASKSS